MTTPLMSRIKEAAEKYPERYSYADSVNREVSQDFIAGAQFLLTELSRVTDGYHRRIWFGGSCDEWALSPNEGWEEFAPVAELLAEKADHAEIEAKYIEQSEKYAEAADKYLRLTEEFIAERKQLSAERSNKEEVHRWNEGQAELIRSLDAALAAVTAERDSLKVQLDVAIKAALTMRHSEAP